MDDCRAECQTPRRGGRWGAADRGRHAPRSATAERTAARGVTAGSPLVEIEQTVQGRAKDRRLDTAVAGGREALRALIEDEVARWNEDHRRGLRPHALADPDAVADRAFRN